jgi:ABC-2 type transport system ATP-binding protein
MIENRNNSVIKVKDLTKMFGDFTANNNLTFEVAKGEIFGFLGANGAGKTTAIRILCGLLEPTSGEISVAGFNGYTERNKIKSSIGYMSQKFSLYEDLTVKENIRLFAGIYGLTNREIRERTKQLLTDTELLDQADWLISSLPLGWRQKLAFSVAMVHSPIIVFLDEPTGGVDPITRRRFWEIIYKVARQGTTVFVTTHYMDEAEYCDRVCILVDGKIEALDTPQNLKTAYNSSNMDEVFLKLAR